MNKKIDEKQKKLYKQAKFYAIIYKLPLYITWKYKYFPQDLRYIKKYGYKN